MTREEHLEKAKQRARETLDCGDWTGAWMTFVLDLNEHPELKNHRGIEMGMTLIAMPNSNYTNCHELRRFIEGFH